LHLEKNNSFLCGGFGHVGWIGKKAYVGWVGERAFLFDDLDMYVRN
jgi:hypothetical protein